MNNLKYLSLTTAFVFFFLCSTNSQNTDSINIVQQLQYAHQLSTNYKLDSALTIYENIFKTDSSQIDALKAMEQLYGQTNQYNEAFECAEKLNSIYPDNPYYLIRCGLFLKKLGENEQALDIFKPIVYNDTTNTFIINQIADIYYNLNIPDSAIHYYNKSCLIKPTPTSLIKGTALLLINKNPEGALSFIDNYYTPEFKNKLLDQVYGKTLYLNDSIYNAYEIFDKLYKGGDTSLVTTKFLGLCCWKASYFTKSISYLENYIQKDTTDYLIYYVLSVCCNNNKISDKAINYMQKSLELYSLDPVTLNKIYLGMAESYYTKKDYNNSIKNFKKLKVNNPKDLYGEYRIAFIYDYDLQNPQKALQYYKNILDAINKDNNTDNTQMKIYCEMRIDKLNEAQFWNALKDESNKNDTPTTN